MYGCLLCGFLIASPLPPTLSLDRIEQGEVSEVEFWEGLQALGLAHDLPRSHASRIVEPFKVNTCQVFFLGT